MKVRRWSVQILGEAQLMIYGGQSRACYRRVRMSRLSISSGVDLPVMLTPTIDAGLSGPDVQG